MPFALMPCLWNKISSSSFNQGSPTRRAHGDKILVDFASPEALEEIFWKTFDSPSYVLAEKLVPHHVNKNLSKLFLEYVGRLVLSNSTGDIFPLYLSKNNNNILRIVSIKSIFPSATFLIPFRDPREHAYSLYRQHQHFKKLQKQDSFVRFYMSSIGHYEFGLDHRPFVFSGNDPVSLDALDPEYPNYWLGLWINSYSYLLGQASTFGSFVNYEAFCRDPQSMVRHILGKQGATLKAFGNQIVFSRLLENDDSVFDESLLATANTLFAKLNLLENTRGLTLSKQS